MMKRKQELEHLMYKRETKQKQEQEPEQEQKQRLELSLSGESAALGRLGIFEAFSQREWCFSHPLTTCGS